MVPVILSGGSGTRLWPLSRESFPKQFLNLTEEETMLQVTVNRLADIPDVEVPIIVCNEQHRFLVAEQMRQIGVQPASIIREPEARNTAPALALAAIDALQRDADAALLVLPADHVIQQVDVLGEAIQVGMEAAQKGNLVTFGIVPIAAETGYGYIRANGESQGVLKVEEFVEKPDQGTAVSYLKSGDYYWNSGMFLFRADRYIEELAKYSPEMLDICQQTMAQAHIDEHFIRLPREVFSLCPSDSIDYAVMEKTDAAVVVPLEAGWNDVGSWSALQEVSDLDPEGNVVHGDVMHESTENCYLRSENRLLVTIGLKDCVVVETSDAVLVAKQDQAQDVKKIVQRLKEQGRDESLNPRRVVRPWGSYEGISQADRFQVKHIVVNPGASLSLQMHHHRAEHWIVVKGTARVTRGEEVFMLVEDQSTYIPLGVQHRLENPGVIPLHLIEVQSGSYLGEDDIVRFEDKYGR